MNLSVNSPQHDVTSLTTLVREMREIGVETPKPIADEITLHRQLKGAKELRTGDLQVAVDRLYTVDIKDFDAAKAGVIDAALNSFVAEQTDQLFITAAAGRIKALVYDNVPKWETDIVDCFNRCVSEYRLNELAPHLPDFSDPGSFHITSMTRAQGEAVEQWKTASDRLHFLWSLYTRINNVRADTIIGPASSEDLSTNLFTACILGDPRSMRVASDSAQRLAALAFRSTSAAGYGSLMPFVIPPLAGYELHLNTTKRAQSIRRQLQSAA